jgi:tetratricopeptide (TPR) repeat protein
MQQTTRFDNVYVSPRVRVALHSILDSQYARKFWDLVNRLRGGDLVTPGMRVERLRTSRGKVYSARLNVEMRIIFSMYTSKETNERSLVIWDANHHDDAYDRVERTVVPEVFQPEAGNILDVEATYSEADHNLDKVTDDAIDNEDITNGLLLFRVPYYVLSEPNRYRSFEQNIDRYLRLSEEQEDLVNVHDRAHLVRGSAGTGKTSLALFYALNVYEQMPDDDIYFFTYHNELACVCRCYKDNLLAEEDIAEHGGQFHVFSYVEFCRHFLKGSVASAKINWEWIDRQTSIRYLAEIISTRHKWAKIHSAPELYGYIYSLLKGRFVPGTDQLPNSGADFKRIFKGYGMMPTNIEDLLEIFGHYEERLSRLKQKDEADLIRYCYQNMKERAVLSSEGKATWIIIDEIQDFTELEWKSILLFWENQLLAVNSHASYPFICGDRNQNISRSGFRWQELDTYVENILKKSHQPQALSKVQLHRNFRNTKEIYDLGGFVHSFSPSAGGDLGLPPQLHGSKPMVVVGSESDFAEFLGLLNDPYDESLPAPMVIVSEDPTAWTKASKKLMNDDGLFFMPLQMSKGLEFEDLIIYRMFSSINSLDPESNDETLARLIDLWYMAITRARQRLLLFMTAQDMDNVQRLFGDKFDQFLKLVDWTTDNIQPHLLRFYHQRERYLPNYAVVFLERTKASQLWEQYLATKDPQLKEKALQLWRRCRDEASLGKAYLELEDYEKAINHLRQASLDLQVAYCFEKLNKPEEAAQTYMEAGKPLDSARCLEIAKHYREAAEIYEKHHAWLQAATNYYLCGDLRAAPCFEHAGMWQSAADLYRGKSNWLKAAELYQKCRQFESAGDMYIKVKDRLDAARCYAKAGVHLKAAQLFEGLMRWGEAAEAYEAAEEFDKAGTIYSKAGRPKDAARCKENAGDLLSAATTYERIRNWEKAAQAYKQLNDDASLARCLENLGRNEEAAEAYTRAKMDNEAGHCYEKANNWNEAADRYLKADNKGAAASMLARTGRRLDAARLYLINGQAQVAAEVAAPGKGTAEPDLRPELIRWVKQTNKPDVVANLYEALGDHPNAAEYYRQAMKLAKAAECAVKAGQMDLAADFYMQDGKFEQAADCFRNANQMKKAAQCYEMVKKWHEARALYEALGDREGIQRCEAASNWL